MQRITLNLVKSFSNIAKKSLNRCTASISESLNFGSITSAKGEVGDVFTRTNKIVKNYASDFVKDFLFGNDVVIEKTLKFHDFTQYGKDGIPLIYPRKKFLSDVNKVIKNLSEEKQAELLKTFNLEKGVADIDGIANIREILPDNQETKKLKTIIEKFYFKNEAYIKNPEIKRTFDAIMAGLPEFNMTIGKVQHGTHAYSVDIHSLKVLQKSMNNPAYKNLSLDSKLVLKMTALMHDFGKKGNIITTGHAAKSKEDAQIILKRFGLPKNIKERIIKQIEHHHWFEKYNKGEYSPLKTAEIFGNAEDINIAKILAKSDLESISHDFHLFILNRGKNLTQTEFDEEFAQKIKLIDPIKLLYKEYTSFEKNMLLQREKIIFMKSNMAEPENGLSLLNGLKDGLYTPNADIRKIINNSKGKMTEILNDSDKKFHSFLDSILKQNQIPEDVTLYRGCGPFDFGLYNMGSKDFLDKFFKAGRIFTIPVYTHTSLSPAVAQSFKTADVKMIYKFHVPKGTNGIFMEGLNCDYKRNEREILLPRNLIYEFKKRTTLPTCEVVEVNILPKKPENKTIHKFWEEVGDDYWDTTTLMPIPKKAC